MFYRCAEHGHSSRLADQVPADAPAGDHGRKPEPWEKGACGRGGCWGGLHSTVRREPCSIRLKHPCCRQMRREHTPVTKPETAKHDTSECSGKQRILSHARANNIYKLADPYNATINVYVKMCHQFGKRRAGELFHNNRSAQCCQRILRSECPSTNRPITYRAIGAGNATI